MPKTPKKKKFVVIYYRNQDAKRAQKTGKKIPLHSLLVDAIDSVDATQKANKPSLTIVSAEPRGRGRLKQNLGFYEPVAPPAIEEQAETEPEESAPVEDCAIRIILADELPAPAEANAEQPYTENIAAPQPTEQAAETAPEALKAQAIEKIDKAISELETGIEIHRDSLETLASAADLLTTRFEALDDEIDAIENRRQLRPLGIETLQLMYGSVPSAINEDDATLDDDLEILDEKVESTHEYAMLRRESVELIEEEIADYLDRIAALKFLRAELQGVPYVADEDEDDYDLEEEPETKPVTFQTPELVEDEEEDDFFEKTFATLVAVVISAIFLVSVQSSLLHLIAYFVGSAALFFYGAYMRGRQEAKKARELAAEAEKRKLLADECRCDSRRPVF